MRTVRAWTLPLGVALLLASAAIYLFVPYRYPIRWVLLAAGVALVVLSMALHAAEVRAVLSRRTARYGAGAVGMILLALAAVVLANAMALRHSARWDLTENRRHSLSPQTVKILQGLAAPIEVIAFFRSDTPGKRTAEDLLKQYAAYAAGKLSWRMEDPDRAPGLARRYGVETYGTVILERAGKEPRSEKVLDAEEEKLTNALVKLTRDGKRVIYVVKGHGEADPASGERAGLSQAKEQMERANYEVKEITLAREARIPDDASMVIVPGPRTDLLEPELAALDAYLGRGGKVFLMANPFGAPGLAKYLARYGFVLGDDVVLELNPIGQLFGVGPQVPVITQYESHPITREMGGLMTLFPLTRSVEPAPQPPTGIAVQALARTSRDSWGETDRDVFQKGTASPDPNEKRGPLAVVAVATVEPGPPAAGERAGDKKPPRARIVVAGTASFANNQYLGLQGNRDFFLNVVSWLAEEEDLISIRAKDTRLTPIILTASQSQAIFWLPVVILPGVVVAAGVAVVAHRRRTR